MFLYPTPHPFCSDAKKQNHHPLHIYVSAMSASLSWSATRGRGSTMNPTCSSPPLACSRLLTPHLFPSIFPLPSYLVHDPATTSTKEQLTCSGQFDALHQRFEAQAKFLQELRQQRLPGS
jgi:hypothetical protein